MECAGDPPSELSGHFYIIATREAWAEFRHHEVVRSDNKSRLGGISIDWQPA